MKVEYQCGTVKIGSFRIIWNFTVNSLSLPSLTILNHTNHSFSDVGSLLL